MSRILVITCGILVIALVVVGAAGIWLLCDRNDERAMKEQAEANVAVISAANSGLVKTVEYQQQARAKDARVISETAKDQQALAIINRSLEAQLQEALSNAKKPELEGCPPTPAPTAVFSLDARLPADVTDALCMRWKAAAGHSGAAGGNAGDVSGRVEPGSPDTGPQDCKRWRKLTVRDAIEYIADLLDHAGLVRLDKAGMRAWKAAIMEGDDMGKDE